MKPLLLKNRSQRAPHPERASADHNFGRGMELAVSLLVFIVLGRLLDHWLGTSPLITILFVVLTAIGQFTRLKYAYYQEMDRLEAERRARIGAKAAPATTEDMA